MGHAANAEAGRPLSALPPDRHHTRPLDESKMQDEDQPDPAEQEGEHNNADDGPTTPDPEEAGGDIISHAESLPTCHDPIYDTVYDALIGSSLHKTHCLCVLTGF